MADNARVVVGCSHGDEDPDGVVVAYLTAGAALDQGREVVLWLSSDGVRLAIQGYADGIRADQDPRFFVCPICFNERELDETQLVDNAELKGASPLMEFATPGTVTFTY